MKQYVLRKPIRACQWDGNGGIERVPEWAREHLKYNPNLGLCFPGFPRSDVPSMREDDLIEIGEYLYEVPNTGTIGGIGERTFTSNFREAREGDYFEESELEKEVRRLEGENETFVMAIKNIFLVIGKRHAEAKRALEDLEILGGAVAEILKREGGQ